MLDLKGKTVTICCFGSFDIIHPGHIAYLTEASLRGNRLVVVVTPDKAIQRYKGHTPVFSQQERMRIVSALRVVDRVILGDVDESWNVLKKITSDIIFLGYDQQRAKQSLCASKVYHSLGSPPIMIARAYRPKRYHSTILKS